MSDKRSARGMLSVVILVVAAFIVYHKALAAYFFDDPTRVQRIGSTRTRARALRAADHTAPRTQMSVLA